MWRTWLLFEKIPESDEDDSQDAQVFPENEEILDMAMVSQGTDIRDTSHSQSRSFFQKWEIQLYFIV